MSDESLLLAGEDAAAVIVNETANVLHIDKLKKYFTTERLIKIIITLIAILIFYIIYRILKKIIKKYCSKKFTPHTVMFINKAVSYVFWIIICVNILSLFGIDLSAIWGAAGIAGLAIGFAAQTSVSNLISGMFVLGEKTLKIGDYITVGDISGTVYSVGLLSVKVSTPDNQMVRIPNSTVINSNLINYNQFSIRRLLFEIPISYESDLNKALEACRKVPSECSLVLSNPAPVIYYDGFGDAIILKMGLWFYSKNLFDVKNQVYTAVVKVFNEYGIIIPYTRYDIKIVSDEKNNERF